MREASHVDGWRMQGVNRSGDRGNLLTRVSADTKMILLSDRWELKKRDEFIDYACGGA